MTDGGQDTTPHSLDWWRSRSVACRPFWLVGWRCQCNRVGSDLTTPSDHAHAACGTTMKIEDLHIGMSVRHPQHGLGTVKALTEQSATIQFNDAAREVAPGLSDLQPAEAMASVRGLERPLRQFVTELIQETIGRLGLAKPDEVVEQLGQRWRGGTMVLKSADPALQAKEVDLETFFHKIVMMRNNLRVLEQKVNGTEGLSSADKFDLQQYITRCYGSMTTFNVLFKNKDDGFSGQRD